MIYKITALTENGLRIKTFCNAKSLKSITSKADFINDAITKVIPASDFIQEIITEEVNGRYSDVFIRINKNVISGQVVVGTCRLVDLV